MSDKISNLYSLKQIKNSRELEDNLETKVSAKNRIDTKPESFETIVTKEKEKLPKKTSPIIIDEDNRRLIKPS